MEEIVAYQEILAIEDEMNELHELLMVYDAELPRAKDAYEVKKREVTERLRGQEPVTTLRDTVRGIPEVAELRMTRDELLYKRQTAHQWLTCLMGRRTTLREMMSMEMNMLSNMT